LDNKLPNGKPGEWNILPVVKAPVAGVEDVGQGNDDEEINLASLSLGSDSGHLERTHVIVDLEVEQNGSLAMKSLLEPEITKAVTSVLNKQFVEQRVFFPTFIGYLLARERSFQMMIEDLLKHRETSRNNDTPFVLKDDVPSWRNIANKRMGYLRDMYRHFKITVYEMEKTNIELMKLRMKMCIKQYHALIP
jgi:hypothetical protein